MTDTQWVPIKVFENKLQVCYKMGLLDSKQHFKYTRESHSLSLLPSSLQICSPCGKSSTDSSCSGCGAYFHCCTWGISAFLILLVLLHDCAAVPFQLFPYSSTGSPEEKVNLQLAPTFGDQPGYPSVLLATTQLHPRAIPSPAPQPWTLRGWMCALCLCQANQTRRFIMHASSLCNFQVSPEVTMALSRFNRGWKK